MVVKLLRYSQLLALAVLVAVVVALSFFYRRLVFDSLVESETHTNVALTKAFANAIWPSHAEFVASAAALPRAELAHRREIQRIERDLRELSRGVGVVKIKIYDLNGLTVYSSDAGQIGEDKSANGGFMAARGGRPASEITYRDRFDAWEGAVSDRNIIATYVPVRTREDLPVEAVLEVYSDVTDLIVEMQRSQWKIVAGVLAVMTLVYVLVQLLLTRYQRLLSEKEKERIAQEARMRHLAYHDPLTDLPNRASFAEHLEEALRRGKRAQWPLALLFVDLDLFKRVNDSLGHDAGDRLLRVAAERIRRSVREADLLFRMGGDEFTVLLEDVRGPEEAAMVAQRILSAITEPLQLQSHEISVSASIGIAMYPRDALGGEQLVKAADTALYRAKELGRSRYAFFAPEMNERVQNQLVMEAALRRALKHEEFILHYQPRISTASGQVVAVEALLRWQHPEWGLVEPSRFISLLEETGLIIPVGAWVIAQACRQAKAWQEAGLPALRISVNLSSRQFRSDTLVGSVREALHASGLAPHYLELELTESLLVENVDHAMAVMGELKALGAALSIDDFGTGYSSLGYLKRFPIDSLKIDRSFVRDLGTSPKDAAIVEAISALARNLGLGLVAEGVEAPWQADFLRARYCTEMQGYLFSRAVSAPEVERAISTLEHASRAMRANALIHSGASLRQGTS